MTDEQRPLTRLQQAQRDAGWDHDADGVWIHAETNGHVAVDDPLADAHRESLDALARAGDDDDEPAPSLPIPVDWAVLFSRPRGVEDWLVPELWPRGRMISLSAPAKARKSLLMLYIAACLAAGRCPWTGQPREPVRVVYLDFEMTEDDLIERLEDMELGPDALGNLRYFLHPEVPHMDTPEGGKMLLAILDEHQAVALVIDTFSRVVSTTDWGGNEVREFYRWSAMHVKARGISIARLDHTGHTNTSRAAGTHAKGADVDVGWVIHPGDNETLKLEHHGLTRVRWVPAVVDLVMTEEPLTFRLAARRTWPPGTSDVAVDLNLLGLPLDATVKDAQAALRSANKGRNRTLIRDALKLRREPK